MKTCSLLTIGFLMSSGVGFSIDRPEGTASEVSPPPLTPLTPLPERAAPLPSTKPVRLGFVPGVVPQSLVAQLELTGFRGVLVAKVIPDSPAAKAGLKENDVIVKLGDTSLSGLHSLPEALDGKAPGDKLTAVLYHGGKKTTAELTLDDGPLTAEEILAAQGELRSPAATPQRLARPLPGAPGMGRPMPPGMGAPQMDASMNRMALMMNALLGGMDVDDDMMDDAAGGLNLNPGAARMLNNLQALQQMRQPMPPMGRAPGGMQSSSSIQMTDSNGTIVVSSNAQGTTVHVTDPSGKVLYSGPYNTREEKDAVPPAVKARLDNVETSFCF